MVIVRQSDVWSVTFVFYIFQDCEPPRDPLSGQTTPLACLQYRPVLSFPSAGSWPPSGLPATGWRTPFFSQCLLWSLRPDKIGEMPRNSENPSWIFAVASAFHLMACASQVTGKWQKSEATLSFCSTSGSFCLWDLPGMQLQTREWRSMPIYVCGVLGGGEWEEERGFQNRRNGKPSRVVSWASVTSPLWCQPPCVNKAERNLYNAYVFTRLHICVQADACRKTYSSAFCPTIWLYKKE